VDPRAFFFDSPLLTCCHMPPPLLHCVLVLRSMELANKHKSLARTWLRKLARSIESEAVLNTDRFTIDRDENFWEIGTWTA